MEATDCYSVIVTKHICFSFFCLHFYLVTRASACEAHLVCSSIMTSLYGYLLVPEDNISRFASSILPGNLTCLPVHYQHAPKDAGLEPMH